jgi:hypothetical protein
MNVFADLHHGDLYHSLRMLFEWRLGGTLYRPIGFDWWKKGFWKYNEDMQVVKQYLRIPENAEKGRKYIAVTDPNHDEVYKSLTFEQFLKTDIDIVIASVRQHEEPYHRLIAEHKPKAKLIRQAGNIHDIIDPNICRNIMAACCLDSVPKDVNLVVYHGEFDLDVFKYVRPSPLRCNLLHPHRNCMSIKNFMNCLPDSRDFYLWPRYRAELSDYDWKMFGILGEDGIIGTVNEIAREMQSSTFIWHIKHGGDGYGYVIHNAFASGRPLITRAAHYKNCLAEPLLEDGVTCIDLDKRSFEDNIRMIREFSRLDKHKKMCENVRARFEKIVNFDKEFKYIKKFLRHLV